MKLLQVFANVALIASATLAADLATYGPITRRQENDSLVDSASLQAAIAESVLLARSEELGRQTFASPDGDRTFGSVGHNTTTQYLLDTIAGLDDYYSVELQYFIETFRGGNATLLVNNQNIKAALFDLSPNGHVSGPVVAVNNLGCNATDFPTEVAGSIALISRGICSFSDKAALAGAAGAVGALIYNNISSTVLELRGTLGDASNPLGPYPPVAYIFREDGLALLSLTQQGGAFADLNVSAIVENRTTQNVIAQTTQGDPNNVLVLGAHTDTVVSSPGNNDNGSGSLGILEVAVQLAKYRVNNAVRFIWWSGEEFRVLGSAYYVSTLSQEEVEKIRLYLNFDMIASPNYVYGIYDGDGSTFNFTGPPGCAEAEKTFQDYFRANRVPFQDANITGRSDYADFLKVGIPSGGLFTGAEKIKTAEEAAIFGGTADIAYDPNYHLPGDTVDNLNMEAFLVNTRAIADSTAKYAISFDSLPPATKRAVTRRDVSSTKRHGGYFHDHAEPLAL